MKKEDLKAYLAFIKKEDKLNEKVSKASAYWHFDHLLQVIIGIGKSLIKSEPEKYKSKFSPAWFYIKFGGKIPRGVGKAPKGVTPIEVSDQKALLNQIEVAGSILDRIQSLPKKTHFEHPYFGPMDLKNSLKFLSIHSNHHLKIIKEIYD